MPSDTKAGGSGIRQRARAGDDALDELLEETAGPRRQNGPARKAWLGRLEAERKLDSLFELEVLLRGLSCFANPRNHPGPPRRTPIVAQDFREHSALVREAVTRIVQLCRVLVADHERAFVFQRYLETVMPDDGARARLVGEEGSDEGPEQSLITLRQGMTNVLEVTTGLARLPRVPFRPFHALLALAQREIARSGHFNPGAFLEFRPEFDRIDNGPMLSLMQTISREPTRKIVALTVLSLFRMLRYLALVESTAAAEPSESPKRSVAAVYVVLSVLRSDARALAGYLRRRSGAVIARAFEGEVMGVTATEMSGEYSRLLARSQELHELRSALENLAANLRLEVRRVFESDLRGLDEGLPIDEALDAARRGSATLRPALQNAVTLLARSLGTHLEGRGVFDDEAARRLSSERLRRDVWMFGEVARAFAGRSRSGSEGWDGPSPLAVMREFVAYFKSMAYPLLRSIDTPHVDGFIETMGELHHADFAEAGRVDGVAREAERFGDYLGELFEAIGRRHELAGVDFDPAGATEALRLYLSA